MFTVWRMNGISCPDLFLIDVMFSKQQKVVPVRLNKNTSSRNKNNAQCTHLILLLFSVAVVSAQ